MKKLLFLSSALSAFLLTACVVTPSHEHTFSENWSNDATYHWHAATCGHNDLTKDLGRHIDENEDGECDVCKYTFPISPVTMFDFKFVGFNCSLNNENSYPEGTSVNLTFTVDDGYHLDKVITVLGSDSYEYNREAKTLSLEVNDDITVVAHALKDEEPQNLGDAFYKLDANYVNYKTEGKEGQYDIAAHSLVVGNQCWQTYVVYDGLGDDIEEKGIEVWRNQSDAESKSKPDFKCEYNDYTVRDDDRFDEYFLKDLSFINLVDTIYARTYFIKDDVKTYGDIDEWSMLKSCHELYNSGQRLDYGDEVPSYVLLGYEIVRSLVVYATQLQTYFDYKSDHLAIDEIYKYGIAHVITTSDEKILFTSETEVADFFDDINNCISDLDLIFDMPCYIENLSTPLNWDRKIHIDSHSQEARIGNISVGQKNSTLEIENIYVESVYATSTMLIMRNCFVESIHASSEQVEIFDSNVRFLNANGCNPCNFHSCTFVSHNTGDRVNFLDCGNITFDNCKFEDVTFSVKDDWSDYNEYDCVLTFKGDMATIIDSTINVELTRSGSSATIIDGVYAENATLNATANALSLTSGYYYNCTFNNVLVSGGYFTQNPVDSGATIKPGYMTDFGEFITTNGTFNYSVVEIID